MNVAVESALILGGAGLLAKVHDVWVRLRTEKQEAIARTDRLEKERLDRESTEAIAVVSHVGGWVTQYDAEDEHDLILEKRKAAALEAQLARLREMLARLTRAPEGGGEDGDGLTGGS